MPVPAGSGFRFEGELSWRHFPDLASRVRRWLDAESIRGPLRRKAFSAFVEMTYNVLSHAAPVRSCPEQVCVERRVRAALALGTSGHEVWIETNNLVQGERAQALREQLDRLGSLGPTELKLLYRSRLANGDAQGEGPRANHAGIGLVTLARDARRPLDYKLVLDSTSEFAFFTLRSTV